MSRNPWMRSRDRGDGNKTPYDCVHCGTTFFRSRQTAPKGKPFCNIECQRRWIKTVGLYPVKPNAEETA